MRRSRAPWIERLQVIGQLLGQDETDSVSTKSPARMTPWQINGKGLWVFGLCALGLPWGCWSRWTVETIPFERKGQEGGATPPSRCFVHSAEGRNKHMTKSAGVSRSSASPPLASRQVATRERLRHAHDKSLVDAEIRKRKEETRNAPSGRKRGFAPSSSRQARPDSVDAASRTLPVKVNPAEDDGPLKGKRTGVYVARAQACCIH